MRIEAWHLNQNEQNPAWKAVKKLGQWCQTISLDPKTVKPFSSLDQVTERTLLGKIFPLTTTDWGFLTAKEQQLAGRIPQMTKLAIVDIDGPVIDTIWPTLRKFLEGREYNLPALRAGIEATKPFWTTLLPLGDIARRVDKLVLWTSRFAPDNESVVWQSAEPLFGNLGSFDAFPFLSQPAIEKIEEHFFPGKTQVIAGKIKGLSKSGFDQVTGTIEKLADPYIVYVGSSLFDIQRFKNLVSYLRRRELPFDQFVFLTNGHLAF